MVISTGAVVINIPQRWNDIHGDILLLGSTKGYRKQTTKIKETKNGSLEIPNPIPLTEDNAETVIYRYCKGGSLSWLIDRADLKKLSE
jgi:hypothetical protein